MRVSPGRPRGALGRVFEREAAAILELGQYILNGLSQGAVYALLASGLTLIFGILLVPNFAQGHLFMLGVFFSYYAVVSFAVNYWLALAAVTLALGMLGILIYLLVFRRMKNAPEVNLFVAALGLLMVLEGGVDYIFGSQTKWFVTSFSREVLTFGGLGLQLQRLVVIIGAVVVMVALQLFIKKTATGAALEATAQDREGAMLCGVKVGWIAALAFAIGTGLAGVAGVLIGPSMVINPTMGVAPLLIAFAAVIFGGLGSIPGAVLGAFVMAMVESLTAGYASAGYAQVFIFGIMIIILLLRPQGLLGKEFWRP